MLLLSSCFFVVTSRHRGVRSVTGELIMVGALQLQTLSKLTFIAYDLTARLVAATFFAT